MALRPIGGGPAAATEKGDYSFMTGAMYAAIGGLKTHMSSLNVIGNNIANVNTQAYKSQRMTFQESMYITSRAGSNGTASQGGNNPSQVGYGASVGSIDLNMSPGTFSPTGYDLDCMLDGEGFFIVGDKETGDAVGSAADLSAFELTRMGDFWVDPNGYVCDRRGKCVYGYAMVQNPEYNPNLAEDPDTNPKTIVSTTLVPLRLPLSAAKDVANQANPRWQEGEAVYNVLTRANETDNNSRRNFSVGDVTQAAKEYIAQLKANNAGPDGEFEIPEDGWLYSPATVNGASLSREGTVDDATQDHVAHVTFNQAGEVTGITLLNGYGDTPAVIGEDGTVDEEAYPGVNYLYQGGAIPNAENKCVRLNEMSINKNGAIYGTNEATGETVYVGYVAVVNAAANDGVTHVDGHYYKAQEGAGDLRVSVLGGVLKDSNGNPLYMNNKVYMDNMGNPPVMDAILAGGNSEIRNGGLEASTADVATEFANMILTQRGYQANTRMVTVTDSMLEELVNMKR